MTRRKSGEPGARPAKAERDAAQRLTQLRAVAEDPLVRPSLRIEARKALKALVPPTPRRVVVEPAGRGYLAEPPEWPT